MQCIIGVGDINGWAKAGVSPGTYLIVLKIKSKKIFKGFKKLDPYTRSKNTKNKYFSYKSTPTNKRLKYFKKAYDFNIKMAPFKYLFKVYKKILNRFKKKKIHKIKFNISSLCLRSDLLSLNIKGRNFYIGYQLAETQKCLFTLTPGLFLPEYNTLKKDRKERLNYLEYIRGLKKKEKKETNKKNEIKKWKCFRKKFFIRKLMGNYINLIFFNVFEKYPGYNVLIKGYKDWLIPFLKIISINRNKMSGSIYKIPGFVYMKRPTINQLSKRSIKRRFYKMCTKGTKTPTKDLIRSQKITYSFFWDSSKKPFITKPKSSKSKKLFGGSLPRPYLPNKLYLEFEQYMLDRNSGVQKHKKIFWKYFIKNKRLKKLVLSKPLVVDSA